MNATVYFQDETSHTFSGLSPSTTVASLVKMVKDRTGFEDKAPFTLAEIVQDADSNSIIHRFLNPSSTLSEEGIDSSKALVCKIKLHKNWTGLGETAETHQFLQALACVLNGLYPSTERRAIRLAGLHLQAAFGDYNDSLLSNESYVRGNIGRYLPDYFDYLMDPDTTYWEKRLIALHKYHSGKSKSDARKLYLSELRTNAFFGITFFSAKLSNGEVCKIGCGEDGLYMCDRSMSLTRMAYKSITSFDRKATTITLTQSDGSKLIFATSNLAADVMTNIASEYILLLGTEVQGLRTSSSLSSITQGCAFSTTFTRELRQDYCSQVEVLKSVYIAQCHEKSFAISASICQSFDGAIDFDCPLKSVSFVDLRLDANHLIMIAQSSRAAQGYTPAAIEGEPAPPFARDLQCEAFEFSVHDLAVDPNVSTKALPALMEAFEDKVDVIIRCKNAAKRDYSSPASSAAAASYSSSSSSASAAQPAAAASPAVVAVPKVTVDFESALRSKTRESNSEMAQLQAKIAALKAKRASAASASASSSSPSH